MVQEIFFNNAENEAHIQERLGEAIKNGTYAELEELLKLGADFREEIDYQPLMHVAARWQNIDAIRFLYDQTGIIDPLNKDGETPLAFIIENLVRGDDELYEETESTIKFLLEMGADESWEDVSGFTLLEIAHHDKELIEMITSNEKTSTSTKRSLSIQEPMQSTSEKIPTKKQKLTDPQMDF
jgi:ankyrin repeat protein